MPVSALNSQVVYDALKANGIRLLSVLPETWHRVSLATRSFPRPAIQSLL